MAKETPIPNPPLTPEQRAKVELLTEAQLREIDEALLSDACHRWRKVARVVGTAMRGLPNHDLAIPDDVLEVFYAERLGNLVEEGHLEAQGNLAYMRFSEVRLPSHTAEHDQNEWFSPLMLAAVQGRREMVKLLLDKGADVNARALNGRTALMVAVGEVKRSDVNATTSTSRIAFMYPRTAGDYEVVKLLLEKGAGINTRDSLGRTALMYASSVGDYEVVKLLLEKGADINARDNRGRTALGFAHKNNKRMVELLKAHGAKE